MPRYDANDTNPWGEFGKGISRGIESSIEMTMLNKAKKREQADKIAMAGLVPIDETSDPKDYSSTIQIGEQRYGKPLTQYDKDKRAAELSALQKKANEPTLPEILEQARSLYGTAGLPPGTKIKHGGIEIPFGLETPAQKRTAEHEMSISTDRQKKLNQAISKARDEFTSTKAGAETKIPEFEKLKELNKGARGGFMGSVAQKAQSMANVGEDSPEFMATATVINGLKSFVAENLKKMFGAQLSDEEREYMQEVYGAVESMSVAEREIAIDNIIKIMRNKAKEAELRYRTLNELVGDDIRNADDAGSISDDPLGLLQ